MANEEADVVISWYATNKEVEAARRAFQRPTRFVQMKAGPGTNYETELLKYGPRAISTICKQFLSGVTPLRVALMGFSEGCQGVREALKAGDAPQVDAAIAIDGIHSQWTDDPKHRSFDSGRLLPWRAFGNRAVVDGRLLVITTSSVRPDFPSTTNTSNYLWRECSGHEEPTFDRPLPPAFAGPVVPPFVNPKGSFGPGQQSWKETTYTEMPLHLFRASNGLVILNYDNLDATGVGDHIFQAERVAPLVLSELLAPRWNSMDPHQPCSGAV